MGLRGRIERSPIGRFIWPNGRKFPEPKVRRTRTARWFADAVRAIRAKKPRTSTRQRPQDLDAPLAHSLGAKMWGGFSDYARPELEQILRSNSSPPNERRAAAWYLVEWHNLRNDYPAVVSLLEFTSSLNSSWRLDKPNLLLLANTYLKLGDVERADALIADGVARYGYDTDLCLLSANARSAKGAGNADDEARLDLINRIYVKYSLHPIRKINPQRPLGIDNITSSGPDSDAASRGSRISVIVPAHNAAKTIGFMLAGLQGQTWRNIEILVVDDASTDNTKEIVESAARADPRITLVALERNSGPYVARNKGLELARGDFITVHDADDWSHSQKLAIQHDALTENDAAATISYWLRATADLRVSDYWRPKDRFVHTNHSSLMVRADTLRELGGWDPVRFHADSELVQRVAHKFGRARSLRVLTGVPLSFGLVRDESLTRNSTTHISTLFFGARQEYRRCYGRWHARALSRGGFRIDPDPHAPRKFPVPSSMLVSGRRAGKYDVIFLGDLALERASLTSLRERISHSLEHGHRLGVFHWPRYDLDIGRDIDEKLARLIDRFKVDMIGVDEPVETRLLDCFDSQCLRHKLDRIPQIEFDELVLAGKEAGDRGLASAGAKRNLASLFGDGGHSLQLRSGQAA